MGDVIMSQRAQNNALPTIFGESPKKAALSLTMENDSYSQGDYSTPLKLQKTGKLSGFSNRDSSDAANNLPIMKIDAVFPSINTGDAVDTERIRIERRSQKHLFPPTVRQMADVMRSKSSNSLAQSFPSDKFDPLPYQPQLFKSSTLLKMVRVPLRHQDTYEENGPFVTREKPLIIHSERYQYTDPLKPGYERLSQKERLLAEREYAFRLKQQKLAREVLPHRLPRELLMGGHQVEFNHRFDVKDELRRLKSIVLPVNARELYHGKGINLPPNHNSLKPRLKMPSTLPPVSPPEPEEELVKQAAIYSRHKSSLDGLKPKKSYKKSKLLRIRTESDSSHERSNIAMSYDLPSGSRRTSDSNITSMILPEEDVIDFPPISPPGIESDADVMRPPSVDGLSSLPTRAESEMDIILPKEPSPEKSMKSKTPVKVVTPNPLKAADLTLYNIPEDEMKALFQRLDSDEDGHLLYPQVETQFPSNLSANQKKFLKSIYDITSSSTYFGVKEFVTLKCLCEEITLLDHPYIMSGYEQLRFTTLTTTIIQFTELFQQIDRSFKGKVSLTSLEDILTSALRIERSQLEYGLEMAKEVLHLDGEDINKVKYIAGIPYFLTFPSLQRPKTSETDTNNNTT